MQPAKDSPQSAVLVDAKPSTQRRSALLALLAILGIALYVVIDIIVQLLPPHYSALSQPESDLAVGPFGYLMAINFVIRGLVAPVLIWALSTSVPREALSRAGLVLVGAWGGGALLLSIFPTDLAGARPTLHGGIHLLVALLAFICGSIGELLLARRFASHERWRVSGQVGTIIAIPTLLFLFLTIVSPVTPLLNQAGGLIERIFIALVLLWMLVIAVRLLASPASTLPQAH